VAALTPQVAERDRYAQLLALAARLDRARYLAEKCAQRLQKVRGAPAADSAPWAEVPHYLEAVRVQLAQFDPAVPVQGLRADYGHARERVQTQRLEQYARAEQGLQRQLAAAIQERLWVVGLLLAAISLPATCCSVSSW
jgi:hypothetical protein